MASASTTISRTKQLTDWEIFTNRGHFNNPLPPSRRLNRRHTFIRPDLDDEMLLSRCRSARSRNQSAISASTRRILSARSINYRRAPRIKPTDIRLTEVNEDEGFQSSSITSGKITRAKFQRTHLSIPEAWSFSCLHRAIITIDEQARKDYAAGHAMNALAAWQNALIYCEQLSQRTQLWPENKAQLDEEIERLKRTYRQIMEELTRKIRNNYAGNQFMAPTRKCSSCQSEQQLDQFHERFSNICQHLQRTICNKCIYKTAKSLLETAETTEIICPEPQCTSKFQVKEVCQQIEHSNEAESTTGTNRSTKPHTTERKTEFIWCAYEGCGSGQFHTIGPNISPIVTCVMCHQQTCAIHLVKWHRGMTCAEFDQQQEEFISRSKKCPGCQSYNEKVANSDNIICSKCKYEFCWECMKDFKLIKQEGPHHHNKTCKHYKKLSRWKSKACTIL